MKGNSKYTYNILYFKQYFPTNKRLLVPKPVTCEVNKKQYHERIRLCTNYNIDVPLEYDSEMFPTFYVYTLV